MRPGFLEGNVCSSFRCLYFKSSGPVLFASNDPLDMLPVSTIIRPGNTRVFVTVFLDDGVSIALKSHCDVSPLSLNEVMVQLAFPHSLLSCVCMWRELCSVPRDSLILKRAQTAKSVINGQVVI